MVSLVRLRQGGVGWLRPGAAVNAAARAGLRCGSVDEMGCQKGDSGGHVIQVFGRVGGIAHGGGSALWKIVTQAIRDAIHIYGNYQ